MKSLLLHRTAADSVNPCHCSTKQSTTTTAVPPSPSSSPPLTKKPHCLYSLRQDASQTSTTRECHRTNTTRGCYTRISKEMENRPIAFKGFFQVYYMDPSSNASLLLAKTVSAWTLLLFTVVLISLLLCLLDWIKYLEQVKVK